MTHLNIIFEDLPNREESRDLYVHAAHDFKDWLNDPRPEFDAQAEKDDDKFCDLLTIGFIFPEVLELCGHVSRFNSTALRWRNGTSKPTQGVGERIVTEVKELTTQCFLRHFGQDTFSPHNIIERARRRSNLHTRRHVGDVLQSAGLSRHLTEKILQEFENNKYLTAPHLNDTISFENGYVVGTCLTPKEFEVLYGDKNSAPQINPGEQP